MLFNYNTFNTQSDTSYNSSLIDTKHHNFKLKFPKFDGEEPHGWIFKAEQYFDFKSVSLDNKVQLASFHLERIGL